MHIHPLHMYVKYLSYMPHMPNLMGLLISITYLAIMHEVELVVGCLFCCVCKQNFGHICPYSMLAV